MGSSWGPNCVGSREPGLGATSRLAPRSCHRYEKCTAAVPARPRVAITAARVKAVSAEPVPGSAPRAAGPAPEEPVFAPALAILPEHHVVASTEYGLIAYSVLVAVIAIIVSLKMFKSGDRLYAFSGGFYNLLKEKYRVDELYDKIIVSPLLWLTGVFYRILDVKIIDGAVNGTAKFFNSLSLDWRKIQTGIVQDYALFSVAGIIAILLYILLR